MGIKRKEEKMDVTNLFLILYAFKHYHITFFVHAFQFTYM